MGKSAVKARRSIASKTVLGIVLMLLLFAIIIILIGYYGFTNALLERYSEDAFWAAYSAQVYIDPDMLSSYMMAGGNNRSHESVSKNLQKICDNSGVAFIYVIQPDTTDYNNITFVFSIKNSNNDYQLYSTGYVRQTTNDDYRTKYRQLYEKEVERAVVVRDKGYIETDPHVTVMIPLISTFSGNVTGILCVQVQMEALTASRNEFIFKVVVALLALTFIYIVVIIQYISRLLLSPLQQITAETSHFAENGSSSVKLSEKVKNKDEIGELAIAIDNMEEQIQEYVKNITTITKERQRIATELSLATKIQVDSIPNVFPAFPDRKEFDIYASMKPAKEVGGDFYDFFLIDDNHLCLLIADVSGKGVPAALFMMATKNIFGGTALQCSSPADILEFTNNLICAKNKESMFLTAWLGILEISTGKLVAANAGHEYPIIRNEDGYFDRLNDKHGMLLGEFPDMKYENYEIQLKRGSKIFLYTDGLAEATDENNAMFGIDRAIRALNKNPEASPQQLLWNVQKDVEEFVKKAEQFDDLTMLCLEYKN